MQDGLQPMQFGACRGLAAWAEAHPAGLSPEVHEVTKGRHHNRRLTGCTWGRISGTSTPPEQPPRRSRHRRPRHQFEKHKPALPARVGDDVLLPKSRSKRHAPEDTADSELAAFQVVTAATWAFQICFIRHICPPAKEDPSPSPQRAEITRSRHRLQAVREPRLWDGFPG